MGEFKYELRRAIYVSNRDGDFASWYQGWLDGGYSMTDLHIDEPDSDGRVGRAFEAQGPLKTSPDE